MRHPRLAALGLLLLTSCGSESEPGCGVSERELVARVQVVPSARTLIEGEQVQFEATAYSCTGAPLLEAQITWQTADGSMLTITQGGLAQAVRVGGPVGVTATANGKVGSAQVTIAPRTVVSVQVVPATVTVAVGLTTPLVARALDSQGRELPGYTASWSSSNVDLATVTQSGVVTGVAVGGPVSVTATIEGKTGAAAITVVGEPVATVEVSPATSTLAGGSTLQLAATLKDDEGNVLSGRSITWGTSNPARALVSSAGVVSARPVTGPVTITATAEGRSGSAVVTVTPAPPTSLSFASQPNGITAGGVIPPFQVEVLDALGLRVATSSATVSVELLNGPPEALQGTLSVAAVNGLATFSGLNMIRAGGYQLQATTAGLVDGVSKGFVVSSGPPVTLAFVAQPGPGVVGELFSNPVPSLWCKDQFNNWASTCVNVTVSLGSNPGGAVLRGQLTADPGRGRVSFDELLVDRPGNGYTLVGSAPGLAPATSDPFIVVPGAPFRMVFLAQPTNSVTGVPFDPVVTMEVQDYFGNRATGASGFIALSVRGPGDTGPPAGTVLQGDVTMFVAEGIAAFPGLAVTTSAERTLTLRAEMTGLANRLSQNFVVRMF